MKGFNYLELSMIDRCNRKCSFCPRADSENHPMQNLSMPPALYQKIASELETVPGVTVMMAGYGEPLLHKGVMDCVRALARTATVKMVTNGDLLSPGMIEDLYACGLSHMAVSIYDQKRAAPLAKMLAGYGMERYELRNRWDAFKLTNRGGTLNSEAKPGACYYTSYSMTMDWNGDVLLCCQDWNKRVKLGNAMCSTLSEIWDGPVATAWRKRHLRGDRSLSPCANCNTGGTLKGGESAAMWREHYGIL